MKKLMLTVLLLSTLVYSAGIFAQAAKTEYTVKTVTGKVEYEVSAGKWAPVKIGMKLMPAAVVSTGLNSALVLTAADRTVTIKAMQKGTVDALAGGVAAGKGGVKIGAAVTDSTVTDGTGQTRTNISTASTRASDATKDLEWAEE